MEGGKRATGFGGHNKYFACVNELNVELWEVSTNKRLWQYIHSSEKGAPRPTCLSFNKPVKGAVLAVGYNSGEIAVVDVRTAQPLHQFKHTASVSSLVFQGADTLFVAGDDNCILKWSLEKGREVGRIKTTYSSTKSANAYLLNVCDKYLLAAVRSVIKVWSISEASIVHPKCAKVIKGISGTVKAVLTIAELDLAIIACEDGYISVWDLGQEGKVLTTPSFRANANTSITSLCARTIPKSQLCLLFAVSNAKVLLFKLKGSRKELKVLNACAEISDRSHSMMDCQIHKKSQMLCAFDRPAGCVFHSLSLVDESGKLIKSKALDSEKLGGTGELGGKSVQSYASMLSEARVISVAENAPKIAQAESAFHGKLLESFKVPSARPKERSLAAVEAALMQALKSGDQDNIDWALRTSDTEVVSNTVGGLDGEASQLLLRAILMKLEQKRQDQEFTQSLYHWLYSLFKHRALAIMSDRSSLSPLVSLAKSLEERTSSFDKLLMLKGKLDLLLQLQGERGKGVKAVEPKYEAVRMLDENEEEEIEGVEVLDVGEYKKASEMMQEEGEERVPAEPEERSEEMPDFVELDDEEDEPIQD